jgi:hypothetical protein
LAFRNNLFANKLPKIFCGNEVLNNFFLQRAVTFYFKKKWKRPGQNIWREKNLK